MLDYACSVYIHVSKSITSNMQEYLWDKLTNIPYIYVLLGYLKFSFCVHVLVHAV